MSFLSRITGLFGGASKASLPAVPTAPSPAAVPPAAGLNDLQSAALTQANAMAAEYEGVRLPPYQDLVGVWTIGYGSTTDLDGKPVTAATPPLTPAQARWLLARDVRAAAVDAAATVSVTLDENQWAAIDDFVFNLGIGAFRSSTLLRDINAGNLTAAAAQFDQWDHAGGQVVAGLLRRRQAETTLFNS